MTNDYYQIMILIMKVVMLVFFLGLKPTFRTVAWFESTQMCIELELSSELNKNISRLGGFVSTMINYSLIAVLTLVLID